MHVSSIINSSAVVKTVYSLKIYFVIIFLYTHIGILTGVTEFVYCIEMLLVCDLRKETGVLMNKSMYKMDPEIQSKSIPNYWQLLIIITIIYWEPR